jgi:outer membrane protein assembly factor BamB
MWIIGGHTTGSGCLADVWCSADGLNWREARQTAEWTAREYHASVVFNGKMWVIGGYDYTGHYKNDVWSSTDGANWSLVTDSAPWFARAYHAAVVFNNKIWILGGCPSASGFGDVWYSSDGSTWTLATDSAGWSQRHSHSVAVFANKMWVIGGRDNSSNPLDEVWYSSDGAHWTEATDSAGWRPRSNHSSAVYANRLWVIGGVGEPSVLGGAWFSPDGVQWDSTTGNNSSCCQREGHTSVVHDNKLWLAAGDHPGGGLNDVWYSRGGIVLFSPVIGDAWAGGSDHLLRWRSLGPELVRHRLLLSTDHGGTYPDTIGSNVGPTESTFNWTVNRVHSTTCYFKIEMLNGSDSIFEEAQVGPFEIDSRPPAAVRDLDTTGFVMDSVSLRWTAPGDDSVTGRATEYDIRYAFAPINDSSWQYATQCTGEPTPDSAGTVQSYLVTNLQVNRRYYFALKTCDNVGNWSALSNTPSCSTFYYVLALSQYPMFRHDPMRNGRSQYNGAEDPGIRWSYVTGQSVLSSPVVASDTTTFVVSDNDTLYAFRDNGSVRWVRYLGIATEAAPAIAAPDRIYVADGYGNLWALHYDLTGVAWRCSTGVSIRSSPVIDSRGNIYVASGNRLTAVNPKGKVIWRHNLAGNMRSSAALFADSVLYVADDNGALNAIRLDGSDKWTMIAPSALYSTPLVNSRGTVYVGGCDGKLRAYDQAGVAKWYFTTGDSIVSSPGMDSNGRIFFGSCDSCVYAVEDSNTYAKLVWKYRTGGKVRSSPSIGAQGTVYIGSDDGYVYAFAGSDSTAIWTMLTGGPVRSSPAIGAQGTVYVGSNDGRLYAIGLAPEAIREQKRGGEVTNRIPSSEAFFPASPNPFSEAVSIAFGLPREAFVKVRIYSGSGRLVRTVLSGAQEAGYHSTRWNGTDDFGAPLSAGVYFCKLEANEHRIVQRLLKVR